MTNFEVMTDAELTKARESAAYLLSHEIRGYLPMSLAAPLSAVAVDLGNEARAREDHDTLDFPVPLYEALGFASPEGTHHPG